MSNWSELRSAADIELLVEVFDRFHGACLKEVLVRSGASVDADYRMTVPFKRDLTAFLYFQRPRRAPASIELRLSEVLRVELDPTDNGRGSIIDRADLSLDAQGRFVFVIDFDCASPLPGHRAGYRVCCGLAAWRAIDGLGADDRYARAGLAQGKDVAGT